MYVLREKAIEATQSMQFAKNSPIAGTMKRFFGLYCDTGLWQRQKDRHNLILEGLSLMRETFSEVIFYYEDLQCVWILVVVGWLISMFVFVGEVVWCRIYKVKQKGRQKQSASTVAKKAPQPSGLPHPRRSVSKLFSFRCDI
uniref:Uncharacterized protein n=1 Tax=Anopheles merus TaxID=30066 RepID=A0A182UZ04_ANOME